MRYSEKSALMLEMLWMIRMDYSTDDNSAVALAVLTALLLIKVWFCRSVDNVSRKSGRE